MTQNNETAPQPKNTDIKFSIAMLLEIGFEALKAVERSNPKSFPRDLKGKIYPAFEQALSNPVPETGWRTDFKGKHHSLKIQYGFLKLLLKGKKTFEIRKDDRNYQEGDVLIFEHDYKKYYFGVQYKTVFEQQHNYCVLGVKQLPQPPQGDL